MCIYIYIYYSIYIDIYVYIIYMVYERRSLQVSCVPISSEKIAGLVLELRYIFGVWGAQ